MTSFLNQSLVSTSPDIPSSIQAMAVASGIGLKAEQPWDLQINDPVFFNAVMKDGSLGLGESYMLGQWDCKQLDEFFTRLLSVGMDKQLMDLAPIKGLFQIARQKFINLQSRQRSNQVALAHYDVGKDVFEAMLDPTMSYSCGYWASSDTLEAAQNAKLELVCQKLELTPGDHVLDIGCGWGSLAGYAAEHYGVTVTGITISQEQLAYAKEKYRHLPVSFCLMDYRELQGTYDKVVSIGMYEHVGQKNYRTYFQRVEHVLKDDGLFLLHTIGCQDPVPYTDQWIDRYIFPNGRIPTAIELVEALNDRFLIDDWHSFGQDYDRTLMAWSNRFDKSWPHLCERYDDRFYRMWHYYLMSSAAYFRSRQGQLWQLVLSKRNRKKMYRSLR